MISNLCYPASCKIVNICVYSCLYCQLVPNHQSCGGVCGDNSQSYTATVINAAKVCTDVCLMNNVSAYMLQSYVCTCRY